MQASDGILVIVTNVMIELVVFLVLDLIFTASPDGTHLVDHFPVQFNGERNEVGILLDDGLNLGGLGKLLVLFLEFNEDSRPSWPVRGSFNFVASTTFG